MPARGKFITLEGVEGVGKTTNREHVENLLTRAGIDYVATREPGGTELGEQLRQLVLHNATSICPATELLIMTASRVEHVKQVIEPALSQGQWVLCDRFIDASVAYQGAGRGMGTDTVLQLHHLMGIRLRPDLTILLDLPVETGLQRMRSRGEPDRIERESVEFFERIRRAYQHRASTEPDRVQCIDASQPLEAVKQAVADALASLLSSNG